MEDEQAQSLVANEATNRAPVLTVPVYFTKILDLADSGTDIRLRLLVEDDTISSNFLFTIAGDFDHFFKIVRDTDNPASDNNTTAFKLVIQEDAVIDFGDQSYVLDKTDETGIVYGSDISDELLLGNAVTQAYTFGGNDKINITSIAQNIFGGAGRNSLIADEFDGDQLDNYTIILENLDNVQDVSTNAPIISGNDDDNFIDARLNNTFFGANI